MAATTAKSYGDEINRSWIFRTVGYGHDAQTWKDIVSNLKLVGLRLRSLHRARGQPDVSVNEGFQKAVSFLKDVVISEKAGEMWWA